MILGWLHFSGKMPKTGISEKMSRLKKSNDDKIFSEKESSKEKENKEIVVKIKEKKINPLSYYKKAFKYFNQSNYSNASLQFMNFISSYENNNPLNNTLLKARTYLAFCYLFAGIRNKKEELIEKSNEEFLALYKLLPSHHSLFPKVVLGLGRSARYQENYPEGIDVILKETLIRAPKKLRKHLYLELGYFYFYANNIEASLSYFQKSSLPIANKNFFKLLLEKENSSLYLLNLYEHKMVPEYHLKTLKIKIQKKLILEARRLFRSNRKEEAYVILSKMTKIFPNDYVIEEVYYNLAEFYFNDLSYQKALYYYDQVLSNQYLDLDAASLFKKGIIYYKKENYEQSIKYFNFIRESFVSSKYYKAALDWIKEIRFRIREKNKIPKKTLKDNEIENPTHKKSSKEENILKEDHLNDDDLY